MRKVYELTLMPQEKLECYGYINLAKADIKVGVFSTKEKAFATIMELIHQWKLYPETLKTLPGQDNWTSYQIERPGTGGRHELFTITEMEVQE